MQPRAVDVGTGSGCLAIACTHQHPSARFIAIDISPEALAVARANAEQHAVSDRIDFRLGDLLEPVAGEPPFDVILSNPPYIPTEQIPTLEPGVRDYEPHVALDGGPDGLRTVARLIDQAIPLLKPGGHLILEIGTAQEEPVRGLIEAHAEYRLVPTIHDLQKHPGSSGRSGESPEIDGPAERCPIESVGLGRLAGMDRRVSARLAIVGHLSSRLRAVNLRSTSQSSSESLGLTLAASRGSVLSRWSMVVVEHDAV